MKFSIRYAMLALAPLFLMAADKGGKHGGKAAAPKPKTPETPDEVEAAMRRQSAAAAAVLRDQAEARARNTGQPVEVTPTADELFEKAKAGDGHTEEVTLDGPTAATEFRPGETVSRPATGPLAFGAPIPEHQANQVIMPTPTVNAPGLGSETGIKKTSDNVDARPGPPDPADNIQTPEVPTPNADAGPGHADERHDTPEGVEARRSIYGKIQAGEKVTAADFKGLGLEGEGLKRAVEDANAQGEANKTAREQTEAANKANQGKEQK